MHTMPVGEFFVVCEDSEMVLFETCTVDPAKHAFQLAHLLRWVDAVKPKSIQIVFITEWSVDKTKRITVLGRDGVSLSDSAVSMLLFDNNVSFSSTIIRAGIYSSAGVSPDAKSSLPGIGTLADEFLVQMGGNEVSHSYVRY